MDLKLYAACEPEPAPPRRRRLLLLMVLSLFTHIVVLVGSRGPDVVEREPLMTLRFVPVTRPASRPPPVPAPVAARLLPKPVRRSRPRLVQHSRSKPARTRRVRPRRRVVEPAGRQTIKPIGRTPAARPGVRPAAMPAPAPSRGVGIVHRVQPVYPLLARRRGLQGRVVLLVTVMPDGRVGRIVVAGSSGYRILDGAAVRAIRQWRFRPALREGVRIRSEIRIPVRFSLREQDEDDPFE